MDSTTDCIVNCIKSRYILIATFEYVKIVSDALEIDPLELYLSNADELFTLIDELLRRHVANV